MPSQAFQNDQTLGQFFKQLYIEPSKSPYASLFFFIKKRMEIYDWFKTIDNLMSGPFQTTTPYLSSETLYPT